MYIFFRIGGAPSLVGLACLSPKLETCAASIGAVSDSTIDPAVAATVASQLLRIVLLNCMVPAP
jgi:hypothetical protein